MRPVDELKAADFAEALRPIRLSKPETASRVRQRYDTVMKWCAAQDYIMASPAGVVAKLLAKQPGKRERVIHHPAVPWRGVPALIQELCRQGPPSASRSMLELLILTASRSGKVRGMTWDEVDLKRATWTIPASRMKARLPHRVPLSSRAIEIVKARRKIAGESLLVFPSRHDTPLSDMAMTKLLRDAKVRSGIPGRQSPAQRSRQRMRRGSRISHGPVSCEHLLRSLKASRFLSGIISVGGPAIDS